MRLVPALLMAGSTVLASLALLTAGACGTTAPSGTTITTVFSDAYACGVGIVATAEGTPDLNDLLKCGLTVADVWNLVTSLEKSSATDSGAALSPARVAYRQKLQGIKQQIIARDASYASK